MDGCSILTLPFTTSVFLGKFPYHAGSRFPHQENGDDDSAYPTGLSWGINENMQHNSQQILATLPSSDVKVMWLENTFNGILFVLEGRNFLKTHDYNWTYKQVKQAYLSISLDCKLIKTYVSAPDGFHRHAFVHHSTLCGRKCASKEAGFPGLCEQWQQCGVSNNCPPPFSPEPDVRESAIPL